jgi:hypothetical protein
VNGDSKKKNDWGPSLFGSLDSACRFNRYLSFLGCFTVSPVQNIIFFIVHFYTFLVHIAQQPGQAGAGVLGSMSLAKTNPKDYSCHRKTPKFIRICYVRVLLYCECICTGGDVWARLLQCVHVLLYSVCMCTGGDVWERL